MAAVLNAAAVQVFQEEARRKQTVRTKAAARGRASFARLRFSVSR
jgi:hypothetical protein